MPVTYVDYLFGRVGAISQTEFDEFWEAQPRNQFQLMLYKRMHADMLMDNQIETQYYKWLKRDQLMNISIYNWYAKQANIALYRSYKRKYDCN